MQMFDYLTKILSHLKSFKGNYCGRKKLFLFLFLYIELHAASRLNLVTMIQKITQNDTIRYYT